MCKDNLLDAIEKKRMELFKIVAVNGLNSPLAVKYSQELDLLLNDYNRKYIHSSYSYNHKHKQMPN
ncbi:Spo0E family sporulation regulatory protein-aspartic acid phosphatase [Bacillus aerolatus]|uniref:Spo0E family sporulation regulatory protein-aspartic acid phosphatase n=1 Tax=Bacillus aerolatus TaxID=2653354 RepID=A0A6I1FIG8_9BACI|nr:aspartyl-phosphate phosphatase Spo0E family protein [Bacillus aerolatus]KAB7708190.1 Spo0E family sporulation regulatory protein-aspartic acid phosphatase [Bacillus aerolatus]